MASSLTSLGLGSQGALNYDIIDKLRAVDDKTQVDPLKSKLSQNKVLQSDLSILTTFTAALKSMTSSLSNENSYLKRSTSVSGDAATVTAASGTTIQEFSIDVKTLAMKDVYESRAFTEKNSKFISQADTIKISIDGKTYDIEVDSTTTISQFKDKVFDATEGKVSASILNVGGTDPYKLVIQSTKTGADNTMSITSANGAALNLGLTNYQYSANAPTGAHSGTDTLTFNVGGTNYNISVEDGDTITEIQNKINIDPALGKLLTASIVDGKLALQSQSNNMTVSSANGSDVTFGINAMASPTQNNHIQTATDATFKFNGVEIKRDSNSFSDLVVGINMTLNEVGVSNVSITQDTKEISTNIEAFVSKYNELISNLNASTKYNADTKVAGNFQSVSEIKTLKSNINRQLLYSDTVPRTEKEIQKILDKGKADGITREDIGKTRMRTITDYGVSLNSAGILEFDSSKLNERLADNPTDVKEFFKGSTKTFETKIKGTAINGLVDVANGDLVINDTNIVVNLTGTPSENAESLKSAINSANILGVTAVLNSDGTGINLTSNAGYDITVSGDTAKLTNIGLNTGTTYGKSESTDGYFTKFNSLLSSYISGNDSILELYESQLQTNSSSLFTEKERTIETLDKKYAIMATKFAAYDSIIGKLNAQFQSLSLMIQQSVTSK